MLEKQINGFIEYCNVSGFRNKFIESLSIRLNQFNNFLKTARLRKIKSITYIDFQIINFTVLSVVDV
jgi:hypothetical protein